MARVTEHNDSASPKKKHPSLLWLCVGVCLLIMVTLVIVLPQFYVQDIVVDGCETVSQEALITSSGLKPGQHLLIHLRGSPWQLLSLQYGDIEDKLMKEYPDLESIRIQMIFPSKVYIHVEERKKIAYIQLPDGFAVIDINGFVLQLTSGDKPSGVPVMQGIPVQSAALGERVVLSNDKAFDTSLLVLNGILVADSNNLGDDDFSLMKCVQSIRSIPGGITFLTLALPSDGREFLVRLGSIKNISNDMEWLRYAVAKNTFDGTKTGVLDMSGEEYTFRPIL